MKPSSYARARENAIKVSNIPSCTSTRIQKKNVIITCDVATRNLKMPTGTRDTILLSRRKFFHPSCHSDKLIPSQNLLS